MKGMFLFAQQAAHELGEFYDFEPYHYGPCSFQIYRDLDALEADGLIRRKQPTGQLWSYTEPTSQGVEKASELARSASTNLLNLLVNQRSLVASLSFSALLRNVYRRYPTFASRSIASLS